MIRDPFASLEAEHERALAALVRLESAAEGLEADPGSEPDRRMVRQVLDLLNGEVHEHNLKEERALFPLLGEDAPTALFEEEHRTLWALEQELERRLSRSRNDARVATVAREIADHLRAHIQRENDVLFPLARTLLGPGGLEELAQRLERQ